MVCIIIVRLLSKFRRLDKNVKTILLLLLVIAVLNIGIFILKNLKNKDVWDYKNISTAEELLSQGKKVNDRQLYWDFKKIINNFVATLEDSAEYTESENSNNKKGNYIDYYDVLTKKYKKYLDKKEFSLIAQKFINKFLLEDHLGYKYAGEFTINNIYQYEKNKYLCQIYVSDTKNIAYIGFQINKDKTIFSIFYIE